MTDKLIALKGKIAELVEEATACDLNPDEVAELVREAAWTYQIQESGDVE